MKNFKIKWLLLSFILSIASINQMWAKDIFIDLNEAPYWYTKPEVKYLKGGNYITESASSTDISKIYKATVPDDVEAWEVCRDGGNNNIGWHTEDAKNRCRVYDTGNGGLFKQIVGLVTGGYIYFDNSVSNFTGTLYFVIGHDHNYWNADNKYTIAYEMTNLSGTSLYYVAITDDWSDAEFYAVVGSNLDLSGTGWGSDDIDDKGNKGYTAAYTGPYNLTEGQTYYITTASSGNNKAMTITWKDGYNNIPKNNMTIDVRTKVTGGSYGTSFNAPTSVYAQARQLTNNGTITAGNSQKATASGSTKSATIADVTTGQVDFSYTALDDDAQWAFDGWGTSNSTVSSTNSTYRIDAGSAASKTATTIYAFFTRKPVLTVNCGDNGTSASGSATNNAKTSYSLSATAADGYRFKEWTVGSGSVTFSDNTSATSTATISADATITATFEEIPAGQLEVVAGSNGKVKIDDETSWTSDSYSYTDITSDGDYNIYAQANDHYHFVNWTKSGDGTIKTNAASGVYTMTANGVGTVTANFAETQHDVTVQYRCGTAVIKSNTTASNVGEVTPSTQAAPAIDGYTFSAWTIESGITKTSGALTDGTLNFKTNSSGTYTITANYTAKACSLVKLSAGKNGGETTTGTDAGAMTFDPTTKAYYKDITTTAGPYYFRFTFNGSTKYCSDWEGSGVYNSGKQVTANSEGSKVDIINITSYGDKPAMYYSGAVGSKLRVWFDYQNKKVWTTASLNEQFVLRGSKYDNSGNGGMPGWDATTSYFSGLASGSTGTKTVTLEAGVKYKVKAYDMFTGTYKGKSSAGEQEMANDTYYAVGSGGDFYFTSTAAGTYTFTYHTSSGLKVQFPVSYTVNFNAETFLNGGASHSTSTTGGTVAAVDGNETTFTSGSKIISGGTVVITATKKSGYDFDGFFTNANCTTEVSGAGVSIADNVLTFSSINEAKTAYAKFSEKMTTVTLNSTAGGHITIGGSTVTETTAGVTTTRTIVAVPDAGYYFAGWTVADGSDCAVASTAGRNDNESGSTTLRGLGAGTTGTVTASFVECEKIYFRNIIDDGAGNVSRWSKVYAYLDYTWNGTKVKTNASNASYRVALTRIGSSDVYWGYLPRAFTYSENKNVAFSDTEFTTNYTFYNVKASGSKGAARGDYHRSLNMFVPYHTKNKTNDNGVDYYDNGYWMKYDTRANQGAGYYLKTFNSKNNYTQEGEFIATNDDATFIQFEKRLDAGNTTLKYMITSAGALNYIADAAVTSANCSNVGVSENLDKPSEKEVYFSLTTASEGIYTFVLDQSGDKMKLNVIYPVAVGDYRLKHTYQISSTDYYSYSDVIKASEISGKTVSMYLNMDAGTKSLKLEKCTSISAGGIPVWGSNTTVGTGTGLFNETTFDKGKGVYQFDVTISSNEVSTISNAGLYEGNYYIKTNVAPGGWANYKQNIMEENSINAADFDYYFCKYIADAGTNIKCVIANDYNNAVSDTLVGDATLGVGVQTLPRKGSVRFSYDSKTNTLNRAYISGSSDWETYFLSLQAGSAVITDLEGNAFTENKVKFADGGNWMYTLTLKAQEGARIKLVSNYYTGSATKTQYFKGKSGDFSNANTEELIGGSTSKWYTLKIIYDFKTNHLLSAWSPSGDIDATINLHTDVLLIHNRKKLANPGDEVSLINLTGGDGVKDIDKVYSALRFQKTSDANYVGLQETSATTAASYYRYNYWISFPYDVKMTDIFGINGYGSKWRIQYYDGKERAEKGWYKGDGTTSFWKTMPMSDTEKLNKGEGYVLQLSPSAFKATGSGSLWELSNEVYLYFPSKSSFGNIVKTTSEVELPEEGYVCTKGLFTDPTQAAAGYSHDITDSHWHVFGIPTFNDATGTTGTGHNYYDGADDGDEPEDHNITTGTFYFYKYNNDGTTYNTFTATSSDGFTFQPMHAYMIQMHGTLNFATNSVPASVAARRTAETANYNVQVELQNEDVVRDQTFLTLRDSAEVGFAFNEDLMKIHNDGKTNIYSYAGPYDVAANILPVENRTVALGIEVAANGSYTFHMPSNFSGTVTLIDTYAQTRTNLALEDYEVTLEKGTYEGRFYLELDINKVTTDVVTVSGDRLEESGIRKFIYDNQLYIMKNGVIYDARGNRKK